MIAIESIARDSKHGRAYAGRLAIYFGHVYSRLGLPVRFFGSPSGQSVVPLPRKAGYSATDRGKADFYIRVSTPRRPCGHTAWLKPMVGWTHDQVVARFVSVIVARIQDQGDWYDRSRAPEPSADYLKHAVPKLLVLPWPPHSSVLACIENDGLLGDYLSDNLDAIRNRYGGQNKCRQLGFIGCKMRARSAAEHLLGDAAECHWSSGPKSATKLEPASYLRWLSECEAVLNIPGERWNCYRFSEAVMMGVPVVLIRGKTRAAPPVDDANAILVDDWSDVAAMRRALRRRVDIVAAADRAYRAGWGLPGQAKLLLERMGTKHE